MKKNPTLFWVICLALGWLFDFLFWKAAPGVNFAIYAALCLIGGGILLWVNGRRPARGTLWLLPFILFFAAITFIRSEPLTLFLGVIFTLFLMGVLAITFLGGRWFWYGLADYLSGFLRLAGSMIARPFAFNAEVRREQAESKRSSRRWNLWPVLRGILIALPIVAIFASLLASADVIFGQELGDFLKLFRLEKLPEYIFRLAYILIGVYALAGVFLHAGERSKDEKLLGDNKSLVHPFLGFTESTIVLGSVVILFAAFVLVQFRYFFGGAANVSIQGFTYSEYARRGFGELVVVAFFSLFMILGLSTLTRRDNIIQRRVFSGLSVAVVVLVMVMLVSAYQRLTLYEAAYGFSRLRTYTHVVLFWIGLLLAAVVLLETLGRLRQFALAAVIASLGFGVTLSLINVDGFIVRQNVNRAVEGQGLDVPYLASLSPDSVPTLVRIFENPEYPGLTRDAVGAVLFCRFQAEKNHARNADWRSFTVSRWTADSDLKRVRSQLNGYQVTDDWWPMRVLTPGSVAYDCYGSGD